MSRLKKREQEFIEDFRRFLKEHNVELYLSEGGEYSDNEYYFIGDKLYLNIDSVLDAMEKLNRKGDNAQ